MTQSSTPFGKSYWLKAALLLVGALSFAQISHAQNTLTFTVLQAPCNHNGIIVVHDTSTGVTPPITFLWYVGMQSITHVSNTPNDTLYNYAGGPVFVNAQSTGAGAYGNFGGQPPFTYSVSTTAATCPALGSAQATVTGGAAPYTYQWTESGNNTVVSTSNPASLPVGSYDLLITDANGCAYGSLDTYGDSIYIGNNSPVVVTATSTPANCTNGTATVTASGGTLPYSYQWSNGANSTTLSGLVSGYYTITVTDAQGCYNSYGTYIQQSVYINPNPSVTNATCLQNDGSVIVFGSGGTPPYSYHWDSGSTAQTLNNLTAGYYYLTVTDANNCLGINSVNIGSSTPITATYSTTPSSCTAPTGSATLAITGGTTPYTVNWYTYPAQSGVTASSLTSGTYSFHITDAAGCVRTGTVYIPPVSIVTAHINSSDAVCLQSNGLAAVAVTSGNAPYTYSWSTGSNAASISNLAAGSYSVTITDAMSCSITKYAYIQTSSPINIGIASTSASCIFANDGILTATPTGGTAPYTYHWSNGVNTATTNNLSTGNYWIYITDANGCVQNDWSYVGYNAANNSCYCTITGKVYQDLNTNCAYDAGEPGIQNVMIHCSGFGYAFTDANGDYSFIVPTGSYTLSEDVQYYYPLASCQSNSIPVSVTASAGCTNNVDFANVINPVHDVRIVTTSYESPVPGHVYHQQVLVTNDGSVTENDVQFGYVHDGQLNLSSVNPSLFTQANAASYPNWYGISAAFPSLAPAGVQLFAVDYNVPTNIPLNTNVVFHDTASYAANIANWLNDYTPWNNVNVYNATVVGSFDPNFKEVMPQGIGAPGYIKSRDSVLTYTIHFQNTGTYAAEKVVVKDTLDANLDAATVKPGYSDHTYTAGMSENKVLTFTFNNINLPDSSNQPLASRGSVSYSVHLKPNLANGTQIKNNASIFFDYNAPIKTNTTLNTINNALIVEHVNHVFGFALLPNPTNGATTLLVNTDEASAAKLTVYNVLGQSVQSQNVTLKNGKNMITMDASTLPSGIYFVELKDGQSSVVQKLNVVK